MPLHTNRLIDESSPYLLQHAHNPVHWYPWGDEAFAKAKVENKLVLVSIGYSSCHWCHVMERETFESEAMAQFMNAHFVCIKVDREERPDVDQVYMSAVQLMNGRGGWPLNCFTLPDARPIYGGTYFPPDQWTHVLTELESAWRNDPAKLAGYAERLHAGMQQSELVHLNSAPTAFSRDLVDELAAIMQGTFDHEHGGTDHAPKFPLPNNYEWLLKQAWLTNDEALKAHVRLTLDKMSQGGIFDQVGGGFSRYSTDVRWKVPHFEKMLYDNAQLISLYGHAYQAFGDEAYRRVAERTIAFVQRELMAPEGIHYSALDADSEGEEGRYYVWTAKEFDRVLGADAALGRAYYNMNERGMWEDDRYILLREEDDDAFAQEHGMSSSALRERVDRMDALLLAAREKRVRPSLDDKSLTSWNAMMVSGLCDAFNAFGDVRYRDDAIRTMRFLLAQCRRPDGGLWHNYKRTGNAPGTASINGFLEDHGFIAEALLALYQCTFDEQWLTEARTLCDHAITHFLDTSTGMFNFTSDLDAPLIARKMEVTDNVIPASNSSMAKALFTLGHLLDDERYIALSTQQLHNVVDSMTSYPSGYSNWAQLLLAHVFPLNEIAITGPEALERRAELARHFIPLHIVLGSATPSQLPLLADKTFANTAIFVCNDKVCKAPVNIAAEALRELE